ncbi:MAG TPA: Na+/H+ antiporter [Lacunisphaera sp.]|nr:Na+/H+ antiporter [Lacunisphaera sp.]
MTGFEHALVLLLLLAALSIAGRRLPWPLPITYVVGGGLAALWPTLPRLELDPSFFFLCFVPPLLFSDGWLMPLRDFWAVKRPILTLATGLVVLTTLAVGLVAYWLVPGLPLAMAFALGAVVSPTDAVAVGVIMQRLKVPRQLTAVLNGESLMNDATGLVAFKFALGAALAGAFSLRAAALEFLVLAVGGLALGLAVSWLIGRLRDLLLRVHGADALLETTLSLLTPYAVYFAANACQVSNILAIVAAGLYAGWRDPLRMDAATRQTTWNVWSLVLFWMNGLAFVLLGLQLPSILESVTVNHAPGQLALFTMAIAGTAILVRLLWMYPGGYVPYLLFPGALRNETRPPWSWLAVSGWAGMRGTITLAAALSIPAVMADGSPFPGRDMVIFLSAGVILVTLLLQGTTLEALICRLRVRPDDTQVKEERLARITAVEAGLQYLRANASTLSTTEETAAIGEIIGEYEYRLAELVADGETRTSAQRRRGSSRYHRLAALRAERAALDDLWRRDVITDDIHRPLQHLLDHEESLLDGQNGSSAP